MILILQVFTALSGAIFSVLLFHHLPLSLLAALDVVQQLHLHFQSTPFHQYKKLLAVEKQSRAHSLPASVSAQCRDGFVRPQVNAALFALDSGQVLYVGTDRKRPASIVKNASTSTRQADAKIQSSIVQSKLLLTNHRPPGRKPKSVIRFPWHLSN
ncbi:hypothetical protein T05_12290 [Trichinella murrelli]|uniref:Uncharacterized protein n=1 Tax=Trichinella murrelli TaxID=144512 RepID=A0A0V0TI68_9BILA|nr:hypothetical protein T05_12290 [Trichinella murrelli]